MLGRSLALAVALAGCGFFTGISQERAVSIATANAALKQVTVVSVQLSEAANPDAGAGPRSAWVVKLRGTEDSCVPGGGGCGAWIAEATYWIDSETGEILEGETELHR